MNLVIVESPSKAKTIKKYLGKGYEVIASKGHVIDLPKSKLGVDVENGYEPVYEIKNPSILKEIKALVKKSDQIYLATDYDREGEAIAYHIAENSGLLKKAANKGLGRIVFTEVSEKAIKEAITKPRALDMNLIHSQQARRVLDRVVGYGLSPLLWKKIAFGLSAGRVQSIALRLLVEREAERDSFISEEYWKVFANFLDSSTDPKIIIKKKDENESAGFSQEETQDEKSAEESGNMFILKKIDGKDPVISSQGEAHRHVNLIKASKFIVSDKAIKDMKKKAPAPFRTSTFQQAAINRLNFTSKRSMQIAQSLYEKGLITYMRTDSVYMSAQAVDAARTTIKKIYGKEYLPDKPNSFSAKIKNAQEAHECIRPVNIDQTAGTLNLTAEEAKIYDLIYRQTLVSQMSEQKLQISTISVKSSDEVYLFASSSTSVVFEGFNIVFANLSKKEKKADKLTFSIGQQVNLSDLLASQHFTQPPARYSEASLIKKLEELGVGRPSTYSSIMNVIMQRTYVEKTGKYFVPTDMGKSVTNLLIKYFPSIVDYQFTANVEVRLDNVAEGKENWQKLMDEIYLPFKRNLESADKNIERGEFTDFGVVDGESCELCGNPMKVKLGRYGKFLSCSNYPDCKGIKSLSSTPESSLDFDLYESAPKTDEGIEYTLKSSRYGQFWAHPDYPKVKDAKPLQYKPEVLVSMYGEPPVAEDGEKYLLRKGKFGFFWAHPEYPKVKKIIKAKLQD